MLSDQGAWATTLVSGILGLALKDPGPTAPVACLALAPVLDGYYLAVERQMRLLYNQAAAALRVGAYADGAAALPDPQIAPAPVDFDHWLGAVLATVTWVLYVALIACIFLVGLGLFARVTKSLEILV